MAETGKRSLEVAIVGGGMTGLALAVGLLKRNVNFTLYERAEKFGELGVGIVFGPETERAMERLNPRVLKRVNKVATTAPGHTLGFLDGYREKGDDAKTSVEDVLFTAYTQGGFRVCRRSDFVDIAVQLIPAENVRFGKWLESVETDGESGRAILKFRDGDKVKADVVVGCDGIRSRVRSSMFGSGPSSPRSNFSHQLAFRGIVPLEKAVAAVGPEKTSAVFMHLGPKAFLVTVPLLAVNAMHIEAFVMDYNEWDESKANSAIKRHVVQTTLKEVTDIHSEYGPTVRTFVSLLPENLDKWAIFDMLDAPVPTYARGCVCLVGDAAHASTPNHGAGAGFGMEDALVLSEVLGTLAKRPGFDSFTVSEALAVYSEIRYERSQWLVQSSRKMAKLLTWKDCGFGSNVEAVGREVMERSRKVAEYDTDAMVNNTHQMLEKRLTLY